MAAALIAAGYHGPPELTIPRVFTSWTLDVPVLVVALAVGGAYLAGVRRVRRSGQPWPVPRTVAFCAGGVGALVIATMSCLGVYQSVVFYIRAGQVVLLLLVVPLFAAMGRPVSLAVAAFPRMGTRIEAAVRSRVARVLTFPAITALVLLVVPFVFYFTSWYGAGLRSGVIRELTYVALVMPGLVFFWTLLRVDPVPRAYPYVVTLWVSAVEVIGDAVLGLAVLADPNLIAGAYYHALARPWGPGLHTDQMFGGGTLWILGDIVGLPFLVAQLIQMIREDEGEAARIDAELDAEEAISPSPGVAAAGPEVAGAAPAGSGPDGAGGAAAGTRPWWERDPRFSGRFQRPQGP